MKDCAERLRALWPLITFSSVYRTAAREVVDQDNFLNAVAVFDSDESPQEILTELQTIEEELHKALPYRFGPRTIDLDILLYEGITRNQKPETRNHLVIPHPRMHTRRFVLEPLCELTDQESWKELLKKTMNQQCERTEMTL